MESQRTNKAVMVIPTTLKLTDPCLGNGEVSVPIVLTGTLVHATFKPGDLSLPIETRLYNDISGVLTKDLVRIKSRTTIHLGSIPNICYYDSGRSIQF
jgi:hypothetical protein